jgi:hypothetical protein
MTTLPAIRARVFLFVLATSGVAWSEGGAPGRAEKMHARALFNQGLDLLRANDAAGAQRAFEEAYRTLPNALVLPRIAECEVRREDFAGAVHTLEQYLAERPDAPDRAEVLAQIASYEQKPGIVAVGSTPSGATIWVDGRDTGRTTPAEIELAPGEHRLTLNLPGYEAVAERLTVTFASRATFEGTLVKAAPLPEPQVPIATAVAPRPDPVDEAPAPRHVRLTAPFWTAVGVAAAGTVTGTVLGSLALRDQSRFDEHPTRGLADEGEGFARGADIAFGVAIAAGVTAVVLYFTAERTEAPGPGASLVRRHDGFRGTPVFGPLRF